MSCLVGPPTPVFLSLFSRLLLSYIDLNVCVQIDVRRILFSTRFCRDIFCRHGSHVTLNLFGLYRRYLWLNMSLIRVRALVSLVYPHPFLMSRLVDFYLYLNPLFFLFPHSFLHTSLLLSLFVRHPTPLP
jgi:hypothetical protein